MAQGNAVNINRRPYLLAPDRPPEGEARQMRDGETESEVAPHMKERAENLGLAMCRPSWSPNTMLVHEATAYARESGLDDEFHHAAAGAFWTTGVDLSDMAVLQQLAEKAGLDWKELSPRLDSRQYRQQVLDEYQAARDQGVSGTPTYLIDGELIFGDVSLDDLIAALKKAG